MSPQLPLRFYYLGNLRIKNQESSSLNISTEIPPLAEVVPDALYEVTSILSTPPDRHVAQSTIKTFLPPFRVLTKLFLSLSVFSLHNFDLPICLKLSLSKKTSIFIPSNLFEPCSVPYLRRSVHVEGRHPGQARVLPT
ncbi:hypothetical protein CsSME_00001262 [Camellia sinensis var. sinensis]